MKFLNFVSLFLLAACNSPRDNMISEESLGFAKGIQAEKNEKVQEQGELYIFNKLGITAEFEWLEGPFGEPINSKLRVILKNKNGDLVSLDTERFELGFNAFMPSMGHYLDDPGYFVEKSVGVYENSAIKFNMANDWRMDLMIFDLDYEIVDMVQWLELI